MSIHKEHPHVGLSSTAAELAVAAEQMGIPVDHLKKMLIFLEKMRVEAEKLNIEPSIACNAATTFVSNAIKSNYERDGWEEIHLDCAQALMNYVGAKITGFSTVEEPSSLVGDDTPDQVH